MATFIADDAAAIAARLRELEAERRGDAPLWFAVDVATKPDETAVVAIDAARPGPVVQVQPTPGIGFLASELERHRLMQERPCGVPKAMGLYDPSRAAWAEVPLADSLVPPSWKPPAIRD